MKLSHLLRRAAYAVPVALLATAPPAHADVAVGGTPAPSWQVNGPVYASAVIGDTVYVGGRFTKVVSSTGEERDRGRLAAFSISTGEPLAWNPSANDVVWSLEADGGTVWAGGEFTAVGGRQHLRLAKMSATGAGGVDHRFDTALDNTVRALEQSHGMLYVGGLFTKVNGKAQAYLTRVAAGSGAVPGGFKPDVEDMVRAIVAPPSGNGNDLYIAGNFYDYNGTPQRKIALINAANGRLKPLAFEKPATTRGLDISPDGSVLYGAVGGDINSAVAWSTETGARLWRRKVVGDVHEVTYQDGTLWMGFAEGALDDSRARVRALHAATGAVDPTFAPQVNSVWGVRTIAATDRGVVVGGNFWRVNGAPQRFLAIFR